MNSYYYDIAGIKLMLYGNIELDEVNYSSLFSTPEFKPDKSIKLIKCRKATDVKPCYGSNTIGVAKINNMSAIVFYQPSEKRNGVLLVNNKLYFVDDLFLSGYFIWNYIDLPGILVENNRVMFHSSYIIYDGEAILFCGKSGIGKSTQADLWAKYNGAEIINGDKAVIYMNDGVPYVSSVPVAGTSGICKNKSAPLKAIISLGKAKENRLAKLSGISALTKVFENCIFDSWRDGEADKCIGIISEIIKNVNVYDFACLPDKTAVECLKKEIL